MLKFWLFRQRVKHKIKLGLYYRTFFPLELITCQENGNFLNDPPTIGGMSLKSPLQAKAGENTGVLIHIQ